MLLSNSSRFFNLSTGLNRKKKWWAAIGILMNLFGFIQCQFEQLKTFERNASTLDIIRLRGFKGELYHVRTHDGYVISLYRIINPLADPDTLNKFPVLFGHGVLYDSASMISRSEKSKPRKPTPGKISILDTGRNSSNPDDYCFAFMLSNNNFDVWLFDARGSNENSRNDSVTHNLFMPQAQKFWDFSLDEQALIDIPLMMDYVLTKSSSKKLVYVGYSQSTFFMFALLSTAPQYSDKLAAFVAMAPVAYVSHVRGLSMPILVTTMSLVPDFLQQSFVPLTSLEILNTILRNLCQTKGFTQLICSGYFNGIAGTGTSEFGLDLFNRFYKLTSNKAIKHMGQLNGGQRFGMYDYGPSGNLQKYGQRLPPAYDLGNIKSDRIIFCRGGSDYLSTPEDQLRLIGELGTKPYLDISIPGYNHFDFINGKNLIKLLNGPVLTAIYQLIMTKDEPNVIKDPVQAIISQIKIEQTPKKDDDAKPQTL